MGRNEYIYTIDILSVYKRTQLESIKEIDLEVKDWEVRLQAILKRTDFARWRTLIYIIIYIVMITDLMEQTFQQSVTACALEISFLLTRYSIPTLLLAHHTHLSSWRFCGELIELKIYWLALHSAALSSAEPNLLTFHSLAE
jgi:hypothetical protein